MEHNSKPQTDKYEMQALERPHCSWSEACSACRQPLICQIALYKNTKKHQKYKEARSSEMNIASVLQVVLVYDDLIQSMCALHNPAWTMEP